MNSALSTPVDPQRCVAEQVTSRLHSCDHLSLRRVKVNVTNGAVILHGTVPTFYLKQVAQTLARIDGIERVVNGIEVRQASI